VLRFQKYHAEEQIEHLAIIIYRNDPGNDLVFPGAVFEYPVEKSLPPKGNESNSLVNVECAKDKKMPPTLI